MLDTSKGCWSTTRIGPFKIDRGHSELVAGQKVLISRELIREISWAEATVSVGLTQEQIKGSQLFEPTS